MALLIFVAFFIPMLAVAENNTCPLYFSGYDGSCMVGSEFQDGDVVFGIMANLHETVDSSPWCGDLSTGEVETVEMVRWVLNKLDGYVHGVTFGYRVQDSCYREKLVPRGLLALAPQLETENCVAPRVVGIIDQHTSNQASSLAADLRDTNLHIPIITSHATAPSLSNKTDYPTFLRTIQPDSVAVKAMADVIDKLDMKYVVIVHTGDLYGRQGKDHMVAALRQRNICVASTLEITSDRMTVTAALRDMKTRLEKVGEQGILGVVYYGQATEAGELLRQADGLPNNRGRQFLWVMSEAAGRRDYIFKYLNNIRENVITVTPLYHEIREFTQYWVDLLDEHIHNPDIEEVFYIRDYIEELLQCDFNLLSTNPCQSKTEDDLRNAYVESGYVVVTMDAVYAFAEAVKNLQAEKCGVNSSGMCPDMRVALQTEFLDAVKAVDFTYPHDFPFVPANFTNSRRRIAFNQTTYDPLFTESSPSHIIYKYVCDDTHRCHYREIAKFQNNELADWNLDNVNFYSSSNEHMAAVDLQSMFCTSSCTECHNNSLIPFAYIPGEFLIAAILPIYRNDGGGFLECNTNFFHSRMIHSIETLLYAVDIFNDPVGDFQNHPLHGRLGVVIFDSCFDGVYSYHRIAELHSGQITLITLDGQIINPDSIVVYVGGHYSATALAVAPVLEALKLVQMGYAATAMKLFDYPHFLRTIPADDVQARVIIDFVKEMGWQQIAILYQDDSYGQEGYKNLLEFAAEAHICISKNISIPVNISEDDVFPVMTKLLRSQQPIQVVVLFLRYNEIETILKQVAGRLEKHFTWIGTEAWGQTPKFLEAETGLEALGSITVSPHFARYEQPISNFRSLRSENNPRDPFFTTFWERHFDCFFVNSATAGTGGTLCDQRFRLDDYTDFYEGAQMLIPAVVAAAVGIGKALENHQICGGPIENCAAIKTDDNLQKIISSIKEVSLPNGNTGTSSKVFKSRGDGNIDYVVNNVQKVQVGQHEEYRYVQVAEFRLDTGLMRNGERVIFYDEHGNEKAVDGTCVHDCGHCMTQDRMSISLIATIVVIVVLVIIIVGLILGYFCYKKRCTKHRADNKDSPNGAAKGGGDSVKSMTGVSLTDPPNDANASLNDRIAARIPEHIPSENERMSQDATVPQNAQAVYSRSRRSSDQQGLPFDPTYAHIGDSSSVSFASSICEAELTNISIETGSETYENPTRVRAMYRRHGSLDAHGGAGNYDSSATPTPPYPWIYSRHQHTPGKRPLPGVHEDVDPSNMTALDPQLLRALLEDIRTSSPDVYQRYIKLGEVAALARPTPGDHSADNIVFDNMGFVDDCGHGTDGIHRQGHALPTDSGSVFDSTGFDSNCVSQKSFVCGSVPRSEQSPGHHPLSLIETNAMTERDKSLYTVNTGADCSSFTPDRSNEGTTSVLSTLDHPTHDEGHSSSVSHASTSQTPLITSRPNKPKAKLLPACPNEADIHQSPDLVDAGTDIATFTPGLSSRDTPVVSPTLKRPHPDESQSSSSPQLMGSGPANPEVPAYPSETDIRQDQHAGLSPTSGDIQESIV